MKPNSDIGLNEGDAVYLSRHFPLISKSLIWPELVEAFKHQEDMAKQRKISSRRSILVSICAFVASLLVTTTWNSPIVPPHTREEGNAVVTFLAIVLLVIAIGLGKGLFRWRSRDEWLTHRIFAERLRQVYFQLLIARIDVICRYGTIAEDEFVRTRGMMLETALRRFSQMSYRQSIADDTTLEESRVFDYDDSDLDALDEKKLEEFFRFWKEMRFSWQIDYATAQVRRSTSEFQFGGSLADQAHTVAKLESMVTILILTLLPISLTFQLVGGEESTLVQWAVLWSSLLAIIVVGLKAYRDGVCLKEDNSRNRVYASYSEKLLRNFKRYEDRQDRRSQLRVMQEMEDLAYFEMREFLNSHSERRFSI